MGKMNTGFKIPDKVKTRYTCVCDCKGEVTGLILRDLMVRGVFIGPGGVIMLKDPKNWNEITIKTPDGKIVSKELVEKGGGRCTLFTDFKHGEGIRGHLDLNLEGKRYRLFLGCRDSVSGARVFEKRFCDN